MLAVPSRKTEVITYQLQKLEEEKKYTVAVYQFVRKVPKITQLVINATAGGGGREVYPLSGLVGTKSGRRVFLELYEQEGAVAPPKESREDFRLPVFSESHDLLLVDKKSVVYVRETLRTAKEKVAYFKRISTLLEAERRYCRCVLHVAAKNTRSCNRDLSSGWHAPSSRGKCYNPYATCRSRISVGVVYCGAHYEWAAVPTDELIAFADLKKLSVGANPDRATVLAEIRREEG